MRFVMVAMLPLLAAPWPRRGAADGAARAQNGASSNELQQENAEMIEGFRGTAYHTVSVAPMLESLDSPVMTRLSDARRSFWRS